MDREGPSGQLIAKLRSDTAHLAGEVQADPPDAAIRYYVKRREDLMDEAYAIYGQPGLAAAQDIFAGEPSATALERLRWIARIASAREITPVQQVKLRALLRDARGFVPCRSLARGD